MSRHSRSASAFITRLAMLAALAGPELGCKDQPTRSGSSSSESRAVSHCDAEALGRASDRIAARVSDWTPRSGVVPDFSLDAISAIWTHCPGLPEPAKRRLHATAEHGAGPSSALDAALPGHERDKSVSAEDTKAAWEWQASMLCPDFAAVAEAAAQVGYEDRPAIFWDRCLHRFDFVTREDYLRGGDVSGQIGFALYRWLTEASIEPAKAAVLARAVAFQTVPPGPPSDVFAFPVVEGTARLEDGLRLEVRTDSIYFENHRVAVVHPTRGLEDALAPSGEASIVPELYDRLAEELDKSKELAEVQGMTWSAPPLLLFAHRDLPWSTLRPVVVTASRAGARRVAAVGLAADPIEPLRSVVIHDADAPGEVRPVSDTTSTQELVTEAGASPTAARLVR